MTVVKCPGVPFGYECVRRPHPHEGACELRALPLFEVVYWVGGKLYSDGVAEFKEVAEKFADRLRRFRGVSAGVRAYKREEER